ncbi:hypothetical protein BDQ17DRAFT_1543343 [Cyathus striatus]|nr:hypothetical protein BDQ17DRAFT_1543343 [Cyathus striatus]
MSQNCPICFDDLTTKPAVATACGHLWCRECLTHFVRTSFRPLVCHTCRQGISTPGLRIYLPQGGGTTAELRREIEDL